LCGHSSVFYDYNEMLEGGHLTIKEHFLSCKQFLAHSCPMIYGKLYKSTALVEIRVVCFLDNVQCDVCTYRLGIKI
jgi:hypothetical protein